MFDTKIDTSDLDAKLAGLDIRTMAQEIGVGVAESTRDLIAQYPTPARKKYPFVSAKQRMFVMAAIKRGQITVPFRRSGDLGRSWITEPTATGAELKNTRSYADLVHDAQQQAQYHKNTWPTDQSVATQMEQSGEAERVAQKIVESELGKVGLT
jgi:hypothetical protein